MQPTVQEILRHLNHNNYTFQKVSIKSGFPTNKELEIFSVDYFFSIVNEVEYVRHKFQKQFVDEDESFHAFPVNTINEGIELAKELAATLEVPFDTINLLGENVNNESQLHLLILRRYIRH
jgi:hypothetical protein